jgi:hypothetical protein
MPVEQSQIEVEANRFGGQAIRPGDGNVVLGSK